MLVIDASVAVKWYVIQPDTPKALTIAESGETLIAPDLVLAEAGNAFWQCVRAGLLKPFDAYDALSKLPRSFDTLHRMTTLADEALRIAVAINHPAYDCFYLALARRESAPLVTADKRLAAAARVLPDVEVRPLGG
jgi:predicted nucleic acid-binding protein